MKKLESLASPHIFSNHGTTRIMLCVFLALLPAAITGCLNYGLKAVSLLCITTGTAVLTEFFVRLVMRKPQTIQDFSAAITGLLLGMCLPPNFPVPWAAAGSAFAILIVKQLFGGIGRNFANPALTAKMLLMVFFMQEMHTWVTPDGTTVKGSIEALPDKSATLWDLFLGNTAGAVGETCAVGLLLGGLFLCLIGVISPATPLSFLGSFAFLTWIGGFPVFSGLLSGSLLLCAIFMASDYSTTPMTRNGKIIFGLCCGFLTFFIRHYGGYAEGAGLAVLIMNLFTPLIDRMTGTSPLGAVPQQKSAKNTAGSPEQTQTVTE